MQHQNSNGITAYFWDIIVWWLGYVEKKGGKTKNAQAWLGRFLQHNE